MAKLGASPYMGRLPDSSKLSKTKAMIVINGDAIRDHADRETQLYTMDVYSYSHDQVEDVYEDLLRVFGVTVDARRIWLKLTVNPPGAQLFIKFESSEDIADPTSELFRKAVRMRVKVARTI
jgi:hypothetical protein